MADDWELKSLERELKREVNWKTESIEGRIEALEKENRRREERRSWWIERIGWTLYVAGLTAWIVLSANGH
jgi:hypothetical protein